MNINHISSKQREQILTNFLETIGNLLPLQCPDLEETADAIEMVGLRIRCNANRGLLMYAKLILDRATSANH